MRKKCRVPDWGKDARCCPARSSNWPGEVSLHSPPCSNFTMRRPTSQYVAVMKQFAPAEFLQQRADAGD